MPDIDWIKDKCFVSIVLSGAQGSQSRTHPKLITSPQLSGNSPRKGGNKEEKKRHAADSFYGCMQSYSTVSTFNYNIHV